MQSDGVLLRFVLPRIRLQSGAVRNSAQHYFVMVSLILY